MRIAIAILACALPSFALAQQSGEKLEIWQSSYGNEELIAQEAATLLTSLDASGVLAYEPVFDPVGQTVQVLMRDQNRFVGASYLAPVDQMVCRANPARCTVGSDGAVHWTNRQGDTLNLPAVTFQRIITLGTANKPEGQTVDDVWSPTGDCTVYGITCVDAVRALNQNNPSAYDRTIAGEVTVPQLAYQAEITEKTLVPEAIDNWKAIGPVVKDDNFLARITAFDAFSTFDDQPDVPADDKLLVPINFPWPTDTPDKVDPAYLRKVRIGFVDGWMDAGHAEFGGRLKIETDEQSPKRPNGCGEPGSPLNKPCDHATHVVGIVAAAVDGKGVAGLNPFAEITVRISDIRNVQDDEVGGRLAAELFSDATVGQVDLFNLSWGYPQPASKDPLRDMITDTLRDRLFVVSAGNESDHFEHGACGVLPACFTDAPNVVSVVGLDRNANHPETWPGTNWGADFNIGAIADRVVSTVSGDRVGTLSGTSQAAPQVTATAAYIISAYREFHGTGAALPPVEVKNRLIYTSDIFPDLFPAATGGRLNMRRAMDIDMDQVMLDTRPGEPLRGKLTLLGKIHDELIICRDSLANDLLVKRKNLRRMVRLADGTYVLFAALPNSSGRESQVQRLGPCELRTQSNPAQFIVDHGPDAPSETLDFSIKDIIDFTAAMN